MKKLAALAGAHNIMDLVSRCMRSAHTCDVQCPNSEQQDLISEIPSSNSNLEAATEGVNLGLRLRAMTAAMPHEPAIVVSRPCRRGTDRQYDVLRYRELEEESNRLASGFRAWGITSGARIALLVPPGMAFAALIFGLFKAGCVPVFVDPGMGRKRLFGALADVEPEGFFAIPLAHAMRSLLRRKFPTTRYNLTVGRRLFWDGKTLEQVRSLGSPAPCCHNTSSDDPAAIVFTTGSTGPPKGVLYSHGNFDQQTTVIAEHFSIRPGDVDLCGFPLFLLFNCALGVTTIMPDIDFSRPARVDPRKIVEAAHDWAASQSFGSPAMWHRVANYCQQHGITIPTLRRVISAGSPIPPDTLARTKACIASDGEVHTPYGSTEALPVSSITASEVLADTHIPWAQGRGTCVGRPFPGLETKVIQITSRPIACLRDTEELAPNTIGELIVCGPLVTREYVADAEANAMGKIADGLRVWHRMGDAVYFDDTGRIWFCGRVAHRVETPRGTMFTIPCEAPFNQHPRIFRSALVGIGSPPEQRPVMVIETCPGEMPRGKRARKLLVAELTEIARAHPQTKSIRDFLFHPSLPVDTRHNAKIMRGELAEWATRKLR